GNARFVARGGGGVRVTAGALLDAFLPHRTLADSANPLLRSLVTPGGTADSASRPIGREAREAPGRLEIDAEQRVVAPDGSSYRSLWATGPWASELPVGAFARPRTNAACFRRNDAVAAHLLTAVTAGRAPALAAASPDRVSRPASRDRAHRPSRPSRPPTHGSGPRREPGPRPASTSDRDPGARQAGHRDRPHRPARRTRGPDRLPTAR